MREGLPTAAGNKVSVDETCPCGARFSVEAEGTQAIGMARMNHGEWKKAHVNHTPPRSDNLLGSPVSITFDQESLQALAEALGPYIQSLYLRLAAASSTSSSTSSVRPVDATEWVSTIHGTQTVPPWGPPPAALIAKQEGDAARNAALEGLREKLGEYRRPSRFPRKVPK